MISRSSWLCLYTGTYCTAGPPARTVTASRYVDEFVEMSASVVMCVVFAAF